LHSGEYFGQRFIDPTVQSPVDLVAVSDVDAYIFVEVDHPMSRERLSQLPPVIRRLTPKEGDSQPTRKSKRRMQDRHNVDQFCVTSLFRTPNVYGEGRLVD